MIELSLYGFEGRRIFTMKDLPQKIVIRNYTGDETVTVTYPDGTAEYFDACDFRMDPCPEDGSYTLTDPESIQKFLNFPSQHVRLRNGEIPDKRLEYFIFSEDVPVEERHISRNRAWQHFFHSGEPNIELKTDQFIAANEDTGPVKVIDGGMVQTWNGGEIFITLSENERHTYGYVDVYPVDKNGNADMSSSLQHASCYGISEAWDMMYKIAEDWNENDHSSAYQK